MSRMLRPARAVSPGQILSRELQSRGLSQRDLAAIMGRPAQVINEIVRGSKQITPETALELAAAFGTSPEFWLNLDTSYRLHLARHRKSQAGIERKSRLYSLLPVRELIKRDWIRASGEIDQLEREVCRFLNIASLEDVPALVASFRQAHERGLQAGALIAWMKRVEGLARAQEVETFDRIALRSALPRILEAAERESDVDQLPPLLLSLGVHFVIVPHLAKTPLDCASWLIDGRPVVALTLRYDRIDRFWFTLLYELAHVVAGHSGIHLEDLDAASDDAAEQEARQLAGDWLIDPASYQAFVARTQPFFSRSTIQDFASSQHRHPGIVVGRLQHDGLLQLNQLRTLLVRVGPYLQGWIDTPGPARATVQA